MCCIFDSLTSFLRAPFSSTSNTLTLVGFVVVLYATVKVKLFLWKTFRVFFLARYFPSLFGPNLRALGSWGVVTGASDGIGKEYAIQLARYHQLNVVLISRTMSKLEKVAAEIKSVAPRAQVKCIAVDFSKDLHIYDTIETELTGLDIAILVNNVGDNIKVEDQTYYYKTKRNQSFFDVIRINCGSLTFMTQIVLPRLIEKNKGVIVNVTSGTGTNYGLPFSSVYSGTKAYGVMFGRVMKMECLESGVVFQTLYPHLVATKIIGSPESSFLICDTTSFVASAIATIGHKFETCGCLVHDLTDLVMAPVFAFAPYSFIRNILVSYSETIKNGLLTDQSKKTAHIKDS